jgi:hypothetical protein
LNAHPDLDPATQINADPDSKPCFSRSTQFFFVDSICLFQLGENI